MDAHTYAHVTDTLTHIHTGDHHGPCLLVVMTVFDLFQIIGGFSAIFFTLFVRSQFLRVEEVGHVINSQSDYSIMSCDQQPIRLRYNIM